MARLNSDYLRTLYQESASMFLLSCQSLNNANQEDIVVSDEQQLSKKKKTNELEFGPMQTARSLVLRSLYDKDPLTASKSDYSVCIDSNSSGSRSMAETNYSRSGAHVVSSSSSSTTPTPTPLTTTTTDSFSSTQKKKREDGIDQKKIETTNSDCAVNTSANTLSSIRQTAETISNFMSSSSMAAGSIRNGNDNIIRSDFYCKSCGLPYFSASSKIINGQRRGDNSEMAGNNGKSNFSNLYLDSRIRLTSLKRGRTRRRRASRYAAKQYTFDYDILQKHRGGGKKFSSTVTPMKATKTTPTTAISHGSVVASVMETRIALKRKQAMRRTRDGISKHCVTYKCSCGCTQSFKGFRAQERSDNIQINHPNFGANFLATGGGNRDSNRRRGNYNHFEKSNHRSSLKGKNDSPDDGSFLALTPLTTGKNVDILVSSKKRAKIKKPKKGNQGKSSLNDFLSSLND